jgi:predicted O-methyltransferase YrrM
MFRSEIDSYRSFVEHMRALNVSHIPEKAESGPAWIGGAISPFDSLALYAMLRKYAPKRYVEIGSGMTTRFARQAITDGRLHTRILSIDPEPRAEVDAICDETIREGLETADLALFDQLEAGDIVFMDGSHRSFMNSDVTVFFIDLLPRLKPGVIVHIHDVMLPYDYPEWAQNWYWNEQYLLAVYLMGSKEKVRPLLPTFYIQKAPELADCLATPFICGQTLDWSGGGSLWFTHR